MFCGHNRDLQIGTLPDGRVSAVVRFTDFQARTVRPSAEALAILVQSFADGRKE